MANGRVAIAVLATLLAASAARAEGEGRRYEIHPSLRIVGVADDNLYFERSHTDGGVGMWIQPGVEAGYRGRTFEVGADLGADVRRYLHESALSKEFWRASGFAEFGLLPGLTARVSDAFVPQPLSLGRPENETGNLVQSHRIETQLRYWRELSHARELELGVRGTRFLSESFAADVPTNNGLTEDEHFHANYWEGAAYAELQNPFGRLTSTFVRGQLGYRSFDDAPYSDHTDVSLLVGVRTRRFRNIEAELAGGWGYLQFDQAGHSHRFLGRALLRQRLPGGWTWSVRADNRYTADLAANQFLETTGRIEIEKRFGERTSASLGAFATRFENHAWDPDTDLFAGAEVGLRRQLTRRLQAGLKYRYWTNGGDYSIDDFHQNQITLDLAYRY